MEVVRMVRVGLNLGVDFVGGRVVQLKFKSATDGAHIRSALEPMGLGEVTVQDFGSADRHQYLVRFEKVKNVGSLGKKLLAALDKAYGPGHAQVLRVEPVGAKVVRDLRRNCFIADILLAVFY